MIGAAHHHRNFGFRQSGQQRMGVNNLWVVHNKKRKIFNRNRRLRAVFARHHQLAMPQGKPRRAGNFNGSRAHRAGITRPIGSTTTFSQPFLISLAGFIDPFPVGFPP